MYGIDSVWFPLRLGFYLGDIAPESFRHILPLQFRVIALGDGNVVPVGNPCLLHLRFLYREGWRINLIGLHKVRLLAIPNPRKMMRFIIDDETLGVEARHKPGHKKGDYRSTWVATCKPHVSYTMLEADELTEPIPFIHRRPRRAYELEDDGVSQVIENIARRRLHAGLGAGSLLLTMAAGVLAVKGKSQEALDNQSYIGIIGERGMIDGFEYPLPVCAEYGSPYTLGMGIIRLYGNQVLAEAWLNITGTDYVGGWLV
jgi:hypothetical protein